MTNLLIVGEESGRLDDALEDIGAAYEVESEELIKTLTSLLEPIMILIMGIIVGFIVIAMLLPLFQVTTAMR